LGRIAERAHSITADRLDERLPIGNSHDELGRLAFVINEMLGRLQESFDQMRRFTADVSHELRTPLMAMRSVGEVALHEPRDGAECRSAIGSMRSLSSGETTARYRDRGTGFANFAASIGTFSCASVHVYSSRPLTQA
jgi:signal transduction histidine kinase